MTTTINTTPSTPVREPASGDRFDAIVIGSGAGGLTCANRLVQSGLRVLLAEKNEWLGGYSHGFSQDGFYWDHGGHISTRLSRPSRWKTSRAWPPSR